MTEAAPALPARFACGAPVDQIPIEAETCTWVVDRELRRLVWRDRHKQPMAQSRGWLWVTDVHRPGLAYLFSNALVPTKEPVDGQAVSGMVRHHRRGSGPLSGVAAVMVDPSALYDISVQFPFKADKVEPCCFTPPLLLVAPGPGTALIARPHRMTHPPRLPSLRIEYPPPSEPCNLEPLGAIIINVRTHILWGVGRRPVAWERVPRLNAVREPRRWGAGKWGGGLRLLKGDDEPDVVQTGLDALEQGLLSSMLKSMLVSSVKQL